MLHVVHYCTCCVLMPFLLLGLQAFQVQFGFVLLILGLVVGKRGDKRQTCTEQVSQPRTY